MGFIASLFRRERGNESPSDPRRIEMVQRVLRLSPRLRIARSYWPRLESSVGPGLDYVRGLVASLPAARDASPEAWAGDPCIRAFFDAPQDVSVLIAQSKPLQALFEREPTLQHAYAVLGAALGNGMLSDHQLRMCAASPSGLADEVARQMVDQLLLEALAYIAADRSRRGLLRQERDLLATRLRLLQRQGVGFASRIGGEIVGDAAEAASLQDQLLQNDRELDSLGAPGELLDHELDAVCAVFSDPLPLLNITPQRPRLRGTQLSWEEGAEGETVHVHVARVPGDPPQTRAFTLVRIARVHAERRPRPL